MTLTNSSRMCSERSRTPRPTSSPAASMAAAAPTKAPPDSVKFKKPGPAMSIDATRAATSGAASRCARSAAATSRGALRAALAACRQKAVA